MQVPLFLRHVEDRLSPPTPFFPPANANNTFFYTHPCAHVFAFLSLYFLRYILKSKITEFKSIHTLPLEPYYPVALQKD